MAGEPTITIPVQVMDDTNAFAPPPNVCTQGGPLMTSPNEAGLNGIIGVGQVADDALFTDYFDCAGSNCTLLNNPPNSSDVVNPVSALPTDNNGVVVSLPSISANGAVSTDGTLFFGVGTQSNNQPGTVKTFKANSDPNSNDFLDINTTFKTVTAGGFFDTGSNGYFFNDGSITQCSDSTGFYCPASTLSLSATNKSGNVSGGVDFSVANADSLSSSDAAFNDLGGTFDGGNSYDGFDWGLPFFFGRTVFFGIDGQTSPLGNGPYTAY